MAKISQITAAPSHIKIGDKTWRARPLADGDYGEFERWVQDRFITLAKRNLDGLSDPDRATLLKVAYDKASALTISSPESLALMSTVDGAAFLLYLSLRREHSEMTVELARELATDPSALDAFMDRIRQLNENYEFTGQLPRAAMPKKKPPRPSILRSFIAVLRNCTAGLLTRSRR